MPDNALPGLLEHLVADGFELDVFDTIRRWSADRFLAFYRGPVRVDWMQPILPVYARVLDLATPARGAAAPSGWPPPRG